jgi:hypothetical protein
MTQVYETDWLSSRPVFYNERTGKASHNVNNVIDYANVQLHPEGLSNYLDFGYSVLEQTPVKHVKFLRHSSRLWVDESDALHVEYLDDPVDKWLDHRLSEKDIIDLIRGRVREWENSVEGEIVIPTSGGYDSRLLNWCIEERSRIRSFTYGTSEEQVQSYEVVYARHLSELLGTCWEQIPLGDYHRYFDDWDRHFGISTHAHGMYHFEFYNKILPKIDGGNPLLSGIIGDIWSGSVDFPELACWADVKQLGHTHGIRADSAQSVLPSDQSLLSDYWETQKNRLKDSRLRTIEAMRFKLMLLHYLKTVPGVFSFRSWSPFLDIEVAMAMLNLPPERRHGRLWLKAFFQRQGLDLESMNLKVTYQNTLNMQAISRIPVKPLDIQLLKEVVGAHYVEAINHQLLSRPSAWTERALDRAVRVRTVGRALRRLGFTDNTNRQLEHYYAYLVLLPIENLLRKRALA